MLMYGTRRDRQASHILVETSRWDVCLLGSSGRDGQAGARSAPPAEQTGHRPVLTNTAARENRILLPHDVSTMTRFAVERVAAATLLDQSACRA